MSAAGRELSKHAEIHDRRDSFLGIRLKAEEDAQVF